MATLTPMIQSQSQSQDAPAMLTAPKSQTFSATKQMGYANQVTVNENQVTYALDLIVLGKE